MRLASVKNSDIVLVDRKGRQFHAIALERNGGELRIEPLEKSISYRTAKAREVIGHWRRTTGAAR